VIAEALRRLRLVAVEQVPEAEVIGEVAIGDRLVASALPSCTWTVVHEHQFGGRRMLSLRWRNALILREESALRESKEGWRRSR
jgi:hypothetical protein